MTVYIPHTDTEISEMLSAIGLRSLDDLFSDIPPAMKTVASMDLPPGISDPDVISRMRKTASANRPCGDDFVCFSGGGSYDHYIPPVVTALASRSEYTTSYTPYQAEVAQGVLQALFEYQTMVSRLSGLPVSNASLYDGASAVYEAVNMAMAYTGRQGVWISRGLNPRWWQVIETQLTGRDVTITGIPLRGGMTCWEDSGESSSSDDPPAAIVVAYPNYLGVIEDLDAAGDVAGALGALLIVAFNPVAMGLLRTPGSYGADMAVAEGQSLGIPLSFGGPYLGMLACRDYLLRLLPGRIVGATTDNDSRRAYTTTLRTREQDIRRERATSNICTNQALMAITAAIHLSWLGPAGLEVVASRCLSGAHYLHDLLCALDGVQPLYEAPFFNEFALRVPVEPGALLERLADEGFLGGIELEGESGATGLLVAVTERRTIQEIEAYTAAFEKAMR
ncbi:MAG: aminomethyl-transferring glycine dehydrogenase subunit GcvPA [Actinobacteria bacterium]|nr:aminomethyl-transferring glycine dehydrogenase subunit GcvPA [Actinomycetota bacterium]